jgi:hypothetical protein
MRIGSLILGGIAVALLAGTAQTGCGSSTNNSPGTAGTGSGTAGTTGAAGTGSGTAGATGAAGDGSTAGTGGSTAGTTGGGGTGGGGACRNDMIQVSADITTDTNWACNTYVLTQKIHIDGGASAIATLTIAAGSTIYGNGNPSNPAALISTRNGKLIAVGTPTAPITFTSYAPPGSRVPGDTFAGVVMLGKGVLNSGTCVNGSGTCAAPGYFERVIEGIPTTDERGKYGGTDNAWNCGEIRYARIQFGGYMLATNIELNGLTLGGCGTATKVSYVQVHRGLDDGVEVFGGAVNMDHIVISGVDDDSLDWDFGWSGKVQFLIVHQAYNTGDKGFEADSFADTETITPRSNPEIWNATMIGEMGNTKTAMHLRRGTWYKLRNFLVYGFGSATGGGALDVEANPAMTANNPNTDWPTNISIESSVFFGGALARMETTTMPVPAGMFADNDFGFDEAAALMDAARMNTTTMDPMLPASITARVIGANPSYVPGNAAAVMGKGTPPAGMDTAATYAGAVAPGTAAGAAWYDGWTSFPEN